MNNIVWAHTPYDTVVIVHHYSDVIMGAMAYQITSLTIVYLTVYLGADQTKHQSKLGYYWSRECILRLFGTKQLPTRLMPYCQLEPTGTNINTIWMNISYLSYENMLKMFSVICVPFYPSLLFYGSRKEFLPFYNIRALLIFTDRHVAS